jgi:hypothetical protein
VFWALLSGDCGTEVLKKIQKGKGGKGGGGSFVGGKGGGGKGVGETIFTCTLGRN